MLSLLLTTLVPALLPAVADGVRGVVQRVTGGAGAQPANVDEVIKLMGAETERAKALAALDSGGETYMWVEAIRKLQRPIIAMGVMGAWIGCNVVGWGDAYSKEITTQLAQIVFSYLFGERAYLAARGAKK